MNLIISTIFLLSFKALRMYVSITKESNLSPGVPTYAQSLCTKQATLSEWRPMWKIIEQEMHEVKLQQVENMSQAIERTSHGLEENISQRHIW